MAARTEVLVLYRTLMRHVRLVEKEKQRVLWWEEARATFRKNRGEVDTEKVGKMVHVAQQKLSFLKTITNHGMLRHVLEPARTKPLNALPTGQWEYRAPAERPDFYTVDRNKN
jgi:hypothetical protein